MSVKRRHSSFVPPWLAGLRRLVYWSGRVLQIGGLLLIWWVLLLFTSVADMGALLPWSAAAAAVFYAGWACTVWARKGF
jgi:hypothetical protein